VVCIWEYLFGNICMSDQDSFENFHEAAHAVLGHLHRTVGFSLWMVTRTAGPDWIILRANDHHYGVRSGDLFRWGDSCCSRMVAGQGPMFAANIQDVPAYAAAPIGAKFPITAYMGVPLRLKNGELFGTLCAIHPESVADDTAAHLPLVQLLARLLCKVLDAEFSAAERTRALERAQAESLTDPLTGLFNRRGWEKLLTAEEARHMRYGHPAVLVSIDLDGLKPTNDQLGHAAGDILLQRTAEAIQSATRKQDVIARVGGDEFAVLAVECEACHADQVVERITEAFAAYGIAASVAAAITRPGQEFRDTWQKADEAMYVRKKAKRTPSTVS
jgi:diguanylate cyclase